MFELDLHVGSPFGKRHTEDTVHGLIIVHAMMNDVLGGENNVGHATQGLCSTR